MVSVVFEASAYHAVLQRDVSQMIQNIFQITELMRLCILTHILAPLFGNVLEMPDASTSFGGMFYRKLLDTGDMSEESCKPNCDCECFSYSDTNSDISVLF